MQLFLIIVIINHIYSLVLCYRNVYKDRTYAYRQDLSLVLYSHTLFHKNHKSDSLVQSFRFLLSKLTNHVNVRFYLYRSYPIRKSGL